MATDSLVLGEGHLAVLSSETLRKLDAILPPTWSRANPVDIAEFSHDCAKAKEVITNALAQGRTTLSEPEAKAILAAYSIPVVDTRVVTTGEQAAQVAVELGFPVALEVLSPEVTHKSDVAGVTLDLENEAEVRTAAETMRKRLQGYRPDATRTLGVESAGRVDPRLRLTTHPGARRPDGARDEATLIRPISPGLP